MSSQYAPREAVNCSPLCAEMLGGHCPGESCVYAPTSEIPWHTHDPLKGEREAEFRGYLRGIRHSLQLERRTKWFGFWLGVGSFFVALFLLALAQWALAA